MQTGSVGAFVLGLAALSSPAQPVQPDLQTFRVFLTDGRVLHSHGECAELPEELVCMVKLGEAAVGESHDVLTVPLSRVDLARTHEYARALRAAHYGATRGEQEYAALTADLSRMLAELEASTDRHRRLGIAQVAQRMLAGWSPQHFGYKAEETRHLAGLLDEVIAELRIAAGETTFALDLVANPPPAAASPLLPAPSRDQAIAAALDAAAVTPVAAERLTILRSVVRVTAKDPAVDPALRARASRELAAEEADERRYRTLMQDALARADVAVRHGRVSVLQRLIWEVDESDAALGARRPREMAAFRRRLEIELDLAREQHAAFERWERVKDQLLAYEVRLRPIFDQWVSRRPVLRAISSGRAVRRPDVETALRTFAGIEDSLRRLRPLPEVQPVHDVLRSAAQMARQGLLLAQRLTVADNLEVRRNASAAITGAELLLAQARADLVPALNPRRVR